MKTQTTVRIEEHFYTESKKIFAEMGITFSDAVNMFLAKISQEKRIPFNLELPSQDLKQRINNIKNNENTQVFDSVDKLFINLDDA